MNPDPIDALMLVRINVLPPYCYDDDENERDPEEYECFLKPRIFHCLSAIGAYIEAWLAFVADPCGERVFDRLLHERSGFIGTIPFAYDELEQEAPDVGSYIEHMKGIYLEEARKGVLTNDLKRYEGALRAMLNGE